ncbi:MAG: outer membrane protein assembly factor BamE [Gemmataceae bacterium]|nr:outer membrane protein assembly factor BamE [Gemmataceae bacterium]
MQQEQEKQTRDLRRQNDLIRDAAERQARATERQAWAAEEQAWAVQAHLERESRRNSLRAQGYSEQQIAEDEARQQQIAEDEARQQEIIEAETARTWLKALGAGFGFYLLGVALFIFTSYKWLALIGCFVLIIACLSKYQPVKTIAACGLYVFLAIKCPYPDEKADKPAPAAKTQDQVTREQGEAQQNAQQSMRERLEKEVNDKVRVGMTPEQVVKILGSPSLDMMPGENRGWVVWYPSFEARPRINVHIKFDGSDKLSRIYFSNFSDQ